MKITRRSFLLGSASVAALASLPIATVAYPIIEAARTEYQLWTAPGLLIEEARINLTFSRKSTGTYFDSSGVLQTATIDAPRFETPTRSNT